MKKISIILILSVIFSSLGCQQSYMTKKGDESLPYLEEDKGFLYRASRDAEQAKYSALYDNYAFTKNALYYSALKVTDYPWQKFDRINISIKNLYLIHTPVIDSFLTGTLVAASSALIIYQGMYKDTYIPISDFK
jgi:hypothetical protein